MSHRADETISNFQNGVLTMSTRANIIIKDESTTMYMYRHSDGYPKCAGAELVRFIQSYYSGAMRPNVVQSAGWLIVAGHAEYLNESGAKIDDFKKPFTGKADASDRYSGWKVGAIELTDSLHCDVEYIYIIDLKRMTLSCRVPMGRYWDKPSLKLTKACAEFPTVSFARIEEVAV